MEAARRHLAGAGRRRRLHRRHRAPVAEAAGARVIRQVPNQGKGAALRAGFRLALDEGWDAVLTLDADGQHDPDEIPRFVAAFGAPGASGPRPELIIGRRDFARMPPVRRLSNTLGTAAFSWAVGQPVADNQSGYRLLGRRLMAATLDSRETGFEFEVEMIAVCLRSGWTLAWVPDLHDLRGRAQPRATGRPPAPLRARDAGGAAADARGLTARRAGGAWGASSSVQSPGAASVHAADRLARPVARPGASRSMRHDLHDPAIRRKEPPR